MAKRSVILWSECVNTWEFPYSLGNKLKVIMILPLKYTFYSANHAPDFEDSSILATNNNDFKVVLTKSLQINRDHPALNKTKQSLPLALFDN